ncbi:unnamed protein product, partial [Ectocarpus sp. 13 AM-2016]
HLLGPVQLHRSRRPFCHRRLRITRGLAHRLHRRPGRSGHALVAMTKTGVRGQRRILVGGGRPGGDVLAKVPLVDLLHQGPQLQQTLVRIR